ncbi:chaplin [Streptomyces antibioticus]|uniref:chaplin n=1 Tax=Streptomyces antibioticus TaxID=1890 RepID=UPI000D1C15F1|nr:chaplin [Streptomyces antibioticus]MCX4743489.1 chaplin [Streptomyces antibioticus]MCX5167064.1 chaplin [Streptomyces antibioticus]
MRRVTRNGVLAVAAASGAMAAVTMPAFADSAATGTAAGSPGAVSGNGIQLPVNLPVNLCGNTVNVVGALNPAMGNACANKGGGGGATSSSSTSSTTSSTGSTAEGDTVGSPGVVSGNGIKLPVDVPVNASGNSVNVVGVLNPVFGNESVNGPGKKPPVTPPVKPAPPVRHTQPAEPQPAGPKPAPPAHEPQAPGVPSLAQTGSDAALPAILGSTAMLLGGALLYRRFRPGAQS